MTRRLLTTIAVLVACAGLAATAAQAAVTATLQVTGAGQVGSCAAGLATWNIDANLLVENTDATPVTLVSASYAVNATSTALGGPLPYAVTVTSAGSLPGLVVNAGATATIQGIVLTTEIPCDTTTAQVCVSVTLLGGGSTNDSCADFIVGGTPVPMGTVGLIGLTAVIGAGLLFAQLRAQSRRRGPRAPHSPDRR
jgi:hypothetical protein